MPSPEATQSDFLSALRRRRPALLAAALMASLHLTGGLAFIERELLDLRYRLFDRAATDDLVLVAIDSRSLRALSVWPWPRSYHAEVIERLLEAGVGRIAIDVDFSAPSDPDLDARFEAALAEAGGRVILPVSQQDFMAADGPQRVHTEPLDRFRQHVTVASINVRPDEDGLFRQMTLREPWADGEVPTLSALLAGRHGGVDWRSGPRTFHIDYAIDRSTIPQLSYADVLAGRFDPDMLRGRQVLIGATAVELQDVVPVPVYKSITGVMLQALAYQSLVQGRAMQHVNPVPILLLTLVIALVFSQGFATWPWKRGLAVAGGGCLGLLALPVAIQALSPLILEVMPCVLLLPLLFAIGLVSSVDRQALHLLSQSLNLRRLDALMRDIVENSFDGIVTFRPNGEIETANDAAHRIFGAASGSLIGRDIGLLIPGFEPMQREPGSFTAGRRETLGRRRGGGTFPLELAVSETSVGDERVNIAVVRDITDRKDQEAKLEHQALHDALTGLPNRKLLQDRLEHALETAKRECKPLGLLLLDLDRFKTINDTLGHAVGDVLLCDVARRLAAQIRRSDTIARLGGDEFAVLLPAVTDLARAHRVSQRILTALERPFDIKELQLEVGISVGVALYPDHAEDADSLLQCADVAMYIAKNAQSGLALYDQSNDINSVRHLTLTGELRHAIESDQLSFDYQPQIELASGRVFGVEALARWRHPVHGFIPPDEFILQAEQTGLIGPLTLWAFNAALQQSADWRQAGFDIAMAINLSARNLQDGELPTTLRRLLADWELPAECLTLEITESAIMLDPDMALKIIRRFYDMGIRLAIDDFGTGHSSLAYLSRLPLHELKVDRSFVINMTQNDNDALIVRSTIDLAHSLGLKVVAEGIENEQHMQILRALGCDIGQGYGISRPLASPQIDRWLQEADHLKPALLVPPDDRLERVSR